MEFTDGLAKRISSLGIYNLRRTRIKFCKPVYTEYPPYELELAQEEYVEKMESRIIHSQQNQCRPLYLERQIHL